MRYLVTGATGFIGRRLVERLLAEGKAVVALVRNPDSASALRQPGVTVKRGDVRRRDSLRSAMQGVDGVFHLAAWYRVGVRDRRPAEAINVDGTRNVLEIMGELGIPRGVYVSSLVVFSDTGGRLVNESYFYKGSHLSEYDRTKWLAHYRVAEPLIQKWNLPLVIVQPGVVYGPGDSSLIADTFRKYLQKKLPLLPKGSAFCWGHVDDTVHAIQQAMDKGRSGETYIIAGPRHTLIEAMEMAQEITGIRAPRIRLSRGWILAASKMMGLVEKFTPVPPTYSAEGLRVSAGVTYLGDSRKAMAHLDFRPRPLAVGLAEMLASIRQELDDGKRTKDTGL